MKDCFLKKIFWLSCQKQYTGAIVKKQLEVIKKLIFFMKHWLYTNFFWRLYEWVWTGAGVEIRILKVIKLFDCEG